MTANEEKQKPPSQLAKDIQTIRDNIPLLCAILDAVNAQIELKKFQRSA